MEHSFKILVHCWHAAAIAKSEFTFAFESATFERILSRPYTVHRHSSSFYVGCGGKKLKENSLESLL